MPRTFACACAVVTLVGGPALAAPPEETAGDDSPAGAGVVFVPRLGLRMGGSGAGKSEVSTPTLRYSDEEDYDDDSSFGVGLDVLGAIAGNVRVGGGLWLDPTAGLDWDAGASESIGTDLSAVAVLEGVIAASPKVHLAIRGQAGAVVLFPGGDLGDDIDVSNRACSSATQASALPSCSVDEGPFAGWTWGLGGGLIFPLQRVAPRVDLLYQALSIGGLGAESTDAAGQRSASEGSFKGSRLWLTVGLEL